MNLYPIVFVNDLLVCGRLNGQADVHLLHRLWQILLVRHDAESDGATDLLHALSVSREECKNRKSSSMLNWIWMNTAQGPDEELLDDAYREVCAKKEVAPRAA